MISQTFYDLHIPSNLVGNRQSAKSIMIGTLFLLLQEALACGGFNADATLARIIKQDPEIAGTISIATTRVPDFGEQISNPSHGFRSLFCLLAVTPQLQDIPHTFHPSYELLACKTWTDNPVAICFAESFQPMGIDLVSHFNIIFYPIRMSITPSLLGRGTSTSAESSLSPWDSISAVQSRNTSESPQFDVTALFQSTCSPSQPLLPQENSSSSRDVGPPHISESSSPHSPADAIVISPSHLPAPSGPSLQAQPQDPPSSSDVAPPHTHISLPAPSPQLQPLTPLSSLPSPLYLLSPRVQLLPLPPQPLALHCLVSNQTSTPEFHPSESESTLTSSSCSTISVLLRSYVITDEQKAEAIYKRNFKGLYLKVRNFNAMNLILDIMGYSLPFRVSADPTIKFSNTTAKVSEVLQHFGWAPTSFEHKTSWYGTAKVLSQCSWKGCVPGK